MTCYAPLRGYKGRDGRIVFNLRGSVAGAYVDVACGQCIGCRVARSREWALRCMHESKLYEDNCFITLTYDNAHLPEGNSLRLKHFQDFMKRLRFEFSPRRIRFYACGEYGERLERPHYHACLFNINFPDRKEWKKSASGEMQFRSATLEKLWPAGSSAIGSLTWQSAAYAARYCMAKLTGVAALKYEPHVDMVTGEVYDVREPPFNVMSRRPGLGYDWFKKFQSDAYPSDYLILDGRKVPVPKYYDGVFEREGGCLDDLKQDRRKRGRLYSADRSPDRLKVREVVHAASLKRLSRSME